MSERNGQADERHEAVKRADVDCIHHPPQDADHDRRQHHRDQKAGARQLADARAAVEQQRNAEPRQQLQDHGRDRQLDLHPCRPREARVLEQVDVVARRIAEIPGCVRQRQIERRQRGQHQVDGRRDRDERQHQKCRRHASQERALAIRNPAEPPNGHGNAQNLTPARFRSAIVLDCANAKDSLAFICPETTRLTA